MPKQKKEIPLQIPNPIPEVDNWIILGLDPSLSRTGFALMQVTSNVYPNGNMTDARWKIVGSVKPDDSSDPIWVRGKAMSLFLRNLLTEYVRNELAGHQPPLRPNYGLIISMEYPTPRNDFLVALNRILHLVMFEDVGHLAFFKKVYVQTTNASTLRSLMALTKTGSKNKEENKARAYDFLDKSVYPELDTDACDAVLMAMMARHTSSILKGSPDEVPDTFKTSLCNAERAIKGKGRNSKVITKGTLHRKEYFYEYVRRPYTLCIKDARVPKKSLQRQDFTL